MNSKVKRARIAGFLYLLIVGFGLIAQVFVRDNLVDYSNASVTANNIRASELWYRFGFVSELMMLVCDIGVATILYGLFRDFNKNMSLLSTFFRLASIIILAVVSLSHFATLFFISDINYLIVFEKSQLEALGLLSLKVHGSGYNISLLFFGIHLMLLGYMINKFACFPRVLGILLAFAGLCYFINSIIWFLFPVLVKAIYPAILIPCFTGELLFSLWLLIKGINASKQVPINQNL